MVDARSRSSGESLISKLRRLIDNSGLPGLVGVGDRVAVKVHMGAPLTTRYLRPFYVRTVVDYLKGLGAEPKVVETTGLGLLDPRGTAEKYLRVAVSHGFTEETLNAEILIVDGEEGLDCVKVEVDGFRFREVSIPRRLLEDFDFVVGLAHFKGHEIVGFGGALKNYGVGCVGKETKHGIHFESKPMVDEELCDGCGRCVEVCPVGAISVDEGRAAVDRSLCYGCNACVSICPGKALISPRRRDPREVQLRVVDAAYAVVKALGFRVFNVNFLLEVDWKCDCEHRQLGWSDLPIVPDVGILASTDPVAIDKASIDLVNDSPGIPGSQAYEVGAADRGTDKFRLLHPHVDWRFMLEAAERIGLGSTEYKLVRVG